MFEIGVFARLRNVSDRLRARAEGPPLIGSALKSTCVGRCCLCIRDRRMTNGARLRSRKVLRRKKKEREHYQVNRPLY